MSFDSRYYDETFSDDHDLAFGDQFHAIYRCYSAAFLTDRERTNVENGGKILLPQSALEQLIEQVNEKGKIFFDFVVD
jgi:hypothetical protein